MDKSFFEVPIPDLDWYRDIVSSAPDYINIINRDGLILYANADDLDPDGPRLAGHTIYEFFFQEFHTPVREKIHQVFDSGKADFYELATDHNQQIDWYMTRIGPIIRDEKVVAASLFIRNINNLKQNEAVLSQLNVDLEKKVDAGTQEIKNYVSHLEASEKLNTLLRKTIVSKDALELLVKFALESLHADIAGIYKIHNGQLDLAVSIQHEVQPPKVLSARNDRFFYGLLQSKRTRYVNVVGEKVPGCGFCGYLADQQIQAMLVAPLRSGSQPDGVMYLGYCSPVKYSADDEKLLNLFAESGSNTLHRIRVMDQLKENIQKRENELRVLYDLMTLAADARDMDSLLPQALDFLLPAVHASIGVIHLVDTGLQKLTLTAQKRFSPELESWLVLSNTSQELWEKAHSNQKIVERLNLPGASVAEKTADDLPVYSYLGVPIRSKGGNLGVMSLFWEGQSNEPHGNHQFYQTIADQIGLSLTAFHQRKESEEALIIEERQRLARDLHDSVSQSLYGLVLSADIGNKFLKMKAYRELNQTLTEIGDIALQSLKEMRLMLFELRPLTFDTVGLAGALELRLNTVEKHSGMQMELAISGVELIPKAMDLEIYRIVTEALNNSLKHSYARVIKVRVSADKSKILTEVTDDGKGFSQEEQISGGLGLANMRERARRINGNLTIRSHPDSGTTVAIEIPLENEPEENEV